MWVYLRRRDIPVSRNSLARYDRPVSYTHLDVYKRQVSGQTYSRKIDAQTLATLAGIAESASKFATDLRLLQHLKEVEEPFEKNQIGSSAMPYKRCLLYTSRCV